MWKLVIVDDLQQKTVVNLVRDEYTIGRSAGHAIRLTEQNISRNHAKLTRTAHGFRLEDLSSYNGVQVNGVRVVGRQDLGHNDVVQIGDYRVQVIDETIDTQEQGYRPFEVATEPPISNRLPHRLVELIGPRQGNEYPLLGDRFLLGRGDECDIVLEHGSVSRVHAEVRRIGEERYEIIDKGSANGLRINGQDHSRALLDGRDVIEIGDVVLKYIAQGQMFRASADEGARIAALAGTGTTALASSNKSTTGSVVAAILGAVVVGAGLMIVMNLQGNDTSERTPKELVALEKLINRGELVEASAKLHSLGTLERSLAAHRRLERAWAEATLAASSSSKLDESDRRKLLNQIVKTPTLPVQLREAAQAELAATTKGAVDLSSLDANPEK